MTIGRPPKVVISAGMRFSRLVTIQEAGRTKQQYVLWACRCDCGKTVTVASSHLRSGNSRSCGCLSSDTTSQRNRTHGPSGTRVYRIWEHIHKRCSVPSHNDHKDYGGRGIRVCERWSSFEAFFADMGHPPSEDHSIDRRDTNGHYEKDNCKWSTNVEQANNRRNTVFLTLNGVSRSRSDWARELGLSPGAIKARQRLGWPDDRILTTPPDTRRGAHMRGEVQ